MKPKVGATGATGVYKNVGGRITRVTIEVKVIDLIPVDTEEVNKYRVLVKTIDGREAYLLYPENFIWCGSEEEN